IRPRSPEAGGAAWAQAFGPWPPEPLPQASTQELPGRERKDEPCASASPSFLLPKTHLAGRPLSLKTRSTSLTPIPPYTLLLMGMTSCNAVQGDSCCLLCRLSRESLFLCL